MKVKGWEVGHQVGDFHLLFFYNPYLQFLNYKFILYELKLGILIFDFHLQYNFDFS